MLNIISDFRYPLYPIRNSAKLILDGPILRAVTAKDDYIVDNKLIDAKTLDRRRLIMRGRGDTVYPLYPSIQNFEEFLEYRAKAPNNKLFIDLRGRIFKYKSTKYYNYNYYKIDRVFPDSEGCLIKPLGLDKLIFYKSYKEAIYSDTVEVLNISGGFIITKLFEEEPDKKKTRVKL